MNRFKIALYFLSALCFVACNNERHIVPYDNVDMDEILSPLQPNEEDSPENSTFGPENIPGITFDTEFNTENPEIYVYLQKMTILDLHPKINSQLFDFMWQQLEEYGFVNDSSQNMSSRYLNLLKEGSNYITATDSVIGYMKNAFEAQLDTIESYNTPFNIYFQVYPVYLDKNIVTFRQSTYAYTGGAHGTTVTYLKSYSLESGKQLDFDDIVVEGERESVREEVAAHMAYSYPIYENITTVQQYIDSLNVWLDNFNDAETTVTLNNFPVTDVAVISEGLAFVYQMYELTPGSDGCPIVVIPYKDLEGALLINHD